jgi:hypothetical protein
MPVGIIVFVLSNTNSQIVANGKAMVSKGIQKTELSNWHLAKTFYFVVSFHF